jgi:hypothetical protein
MFQHFTFEIKVVIYRIQCRGIFAKKDSYAIMVGNYLV